MRSRLGRALFLGFGIALLLAVTAWYVAAHFAQFPILDPAGPIAEGERSVIFITLLLCAIVVIPVYSMLAFFSYRYHSDNPIAHGEHLPDWDHTHIAEIICWLVPSVIIILLGVVAWNSSHALDPYTPLPGKPLEVEVIALDWKWLFIYPEEHIATVNLLEIPVGTPVHLDLTADAPMNSFWVPQLAGQIMVMPGMSTQLNLAADIPGDYHGSSANISGEGFAGMSFVTRAVSSSAFSAWASSTGSTSPALTMAGYQALAAPSQYNAPAFYTLGEPNLYTEIINSYMSGMTSMQDMQNMQMP